MFEQFDFSSWDAFSDSLNTYMAGLPDLQLIIIGCIGGAIVFGVVALALSRRAHKRANRNKGHKS